MRRATFARVRAWLVAVLVRPSSLTTIEAELRTWERQTRRRLGLSDEIKGTQIDAAAAESFVHEVVEAGDGASVFWTAYAVDFDAASRAGNDRTAAHTLGWLRGLG